MARTKDRQRALARAKLERQIVRRAASARRKRQIQAGTAAGLALVLVVLGVMWASGVFEPEKKTGAAAADCAWNDAPGEGVRDVGRPPTTSIAKTGGQLMTITTNLGVIEAFIDTSKVPCTAASFTFLANKDYFKDVKCHRLTTAGAFILQCGDPKGDGLGGPGYRFKDENLPTPTADPTASPPAPGAMVNYPKGTIAMANSGPDTNGSQFFIVYKDSQFEPKYAVLGTVTKGLDIVEKVGTDGVDPGAANTSDGTPKTTVTIQSLRLGQPGPANSPAPSTPPSGAPSQSGTPSTPPSGST